MSVILRYREHLAILPSESYWVYDLCPQMPEWNETKHDYTCKGAKRIDARKAKEIIKEEGLSCVCSNEYGRIYA